MDGRNLAKFRGRLLELNPNAAPGLALSVAAKGDVVLLAMGGKKPVGYYLLAKTPRGPKLDYVWVRPEWRGRGISKLMEVKALEWAHGEGGRLTRTGASTNKEERSAALALERFSRAVQHAGALSGVHTGKLPEFAPGGVRRKGGINGGWEPAKQPAWKERRFRRLGKG
ncbi:GNAT family N-acetyltransferase [Candidatus Micrarchaeota archaeon]|nr:GNAT family N-acetyltransferase [Candidatus Micrarchaeota archaeon]